MNIERRQIPSSGSNAGQVSRPSKIHPVSPLKNSLWRSQPINLIHVSLGYPPVDRMIFDMNPESKSTRTTTAMIITIIDAQACETRLKWFSWAFFCLTMPARPSQAHALKATSVCRWRNNSVVVWLCWILWQGHLDMIDISLEPAVLEYHCTLIIVVQESRC